MFNQGAFLTVVAALSVGSFAYAETSGPKPVTFTYDSSVPQDQVEKVNQDLKNLSEYKIEDDEEARKVLGLEKLDASSLGDWLKSRVQIIVGASFDLKHRMLIGPAMEYENPKDTPDIIVILTKKAQEAAAAEEAAAGGATDGNNALIPFPLLGDTATGTAQPAEASATPAESEEARAERERKERLEKLEPTMAFISGMAYLSGKSAGRMPAIRLTNNKLVLIPSPRVGVAQIGKPLFEMAGDMTPEQLKEHEAALSAMRLSVYFHEARHSDGHGKSLGFLHVPCPKGHDYEGLMACDSSLNGAYSVGAQLTKTFMVNNKKLSEMDQQVLALMFLDSISRILPEVEEVAADGSIKKGKAKVWDAAPEGLKALQQ